MKLRHLLAVPLALSGCGSDDVTCKIEDNRDGTRTITCPGSSPIRVVPAGTDGTCTIGHGEDGGSVIQCSDGTVIRLGPDGRPIFPGMGAISGVARLYGMDDHTGITVRIPDTPYSTTTDEDGRYTLADVPAGIYEPVFEYPGRFPTSVKNVPVINGVYELDRVHLKRGMRIGSEAAARTIAPGGDSIVVVESAAEGRKATLYVPENGTTLPLGAGVVKVDFDTDGARLLVHELAGADGPAALWNVAAGEPMPVAALATSAWLSPEGDTVVFGTLEEGGCALFTWDVASRETAAIGPCTRDQPVHVAPDGKSLVYVDEENALAFWELGAQRKTVLSTGPWSHASSFFSPDGLSVVFAQANPETSPFGGELVHFDVTTGVRTPIGVNVFDNLDRVTFDPDHDPELEPAHNPNSEMVPAIWGRDGKTLFFARRADAGGFETVLWSRDTGEAHVLDPHHPVQTGLRYSPDGARLLSLSPLTFELRVIESSDPTNVRVYSEMSSPPAGSEGTAVFQARFSPASNALLVVTQTGLTEWWDLRNDEREVLAPNGVSDDLQRLPWSPDGNSLLFPTPRFDLTRLELIWFEAGGRGQMKVGDLHLSFPEFVPSDDWSRVTFHTPTEEFEWDLFVWERATEQKILLRGGSTSPGNQAFAPGSNAALRLECENSCRLIRYDVATRTREAVDEDVFHIDPSRQLAVATTESFYLYRVVDGDSPERSGIWLAIEP